MKPCTKCHQAKDASEFYRSRANKDGLYCQCKDCVRASRQSPESIATRKKYEQSSEKKATRGRYERTEKRKVAGRERHRKWRHTLIGRLRNCFYSMMNRCNNHKHRNYGRYGGRGIECRFEDSDKFIDYVVNVLGIDTYEKIQAREIHRLDNTGHYEPGNVSFLTPAEHIAEHVEMRRKLAG